MFARPMVRQDGMVRPSSVGDGMLSMFNIRAFAAEVDVTLVVSDVAGGLIHQGTTLTSDVIYTLPTAALLAVADGFKEMNIGDTYSFVVINAQSAAFRVVIAVGTGITAIGANNALGVVAQAGRTFTLVKTAAATFSLY